MRAPRWLVAVLLAAAAAGAAAPASAARFRQAAASTPRRARAAARRLAQSADSVAWAPLVIGGVVQPGWAARATEASLSAGGAAGDDEEYPAALSVAFQSDYGLLTLSAPAAAPAGGVILLRAVFAARPPGAPLRLQLTSSRAGGARFASAAVDLSAARGAPVRTAAGANMSAVMLGAEALGFSSSSPIPWDAVVIQGLANTSLFLDELQLRQFTAAPPPPPGAPAPPGAPVVPAAPPAAPTPPAAPAPPPAPPAAALVPDASGVCTLFGRYSGLAPSWRDASWNTTLLTDAPLVDAGGGVALSAQMPREGGASLAGPAFQGFWALSFWTQVAAPAPTSLLISLDAVDASTAVNDGPSAEVSIAVVIDAETLAGTGRQLPSQGVRRRLAAAAAPWAHIVVPLQQFAPAGGAALPSWNRIIFQVNASSGAALNVTALQLLATTAPVATVKSADNPLMVTAGIVTSALSPDAPPPGVNASSRGAPPALPARTLDAQSRGALLIGLACVCGTALLFVLFAACCMDPERFGPWALWVRKPRTARAADVGAAAAAAEHTPPEHTTLAAADVAAAAAAPAGPGADWRMAAPFRRDSLSSRSGSGGSGGGEIELSRSRERRPSGLPRSLTAPSSVAASSTRSASEPDLSVCAEDGRSGGAGAEAPAGADEHARRGGGADAADAPEAAAEAEARLSDSECGGPALTLTPAAWARSPRPSVVVEETSGRLTDQAAPARDGAALVAGWFAAQGAPAPASRPLRKASSARFAPRVAGAAAAGGGAPPASRALQRSASPPLARRLTRTGSHVVLEDCELLEVLGSGGEGVVWRALWQGAPVAVKVWHDTTGWSEAQLAGICQEVEVLRKLRHPHVVEFYGACTRPPHLCLVMEYAEGGTLSDLIHGGGGDGGGGLPPLRLLQLAEDVASALDYLHAARIVHRDLKPQNVLLSRAGRAAVTDFGIAKHKPGDFLSSQNLGAGTMAYMAPELFGGGAVDERCDQFSFGVVLWEMQSGGTPWKGMAAMQIIMSVALERQRPELPRTCPKRLRALIGELWSHEPSARPAFLHVRHRLAQMRKELQG